MIKEKDLISLKEASQISGYTPDYIGQLIRAGKISGRQIYTNISWMTTSAEVMAYKNKSRSSATKNGNSLKEQIARFKRLFELRLNFVNLILNNFPSLKPVLAVIFLSFILFCGFILYSLIIPDKYIKQTQKQNESQTSLSF